MSHIPSLVMISLFLIPTLAGAESALDGTWDVTFSTRDTETRQAIVVITGSEGTWTTIAQQRKERNDPCVGRSFPLTVAVADQKQIVLEVAFAKVIAGCKDRTVTGQFESAGVVVGKLENGKPLRMLKK
jgi:hypothetical protein